MSRPMQWRSALAAVVAACAGFGAAHGQSLKERMFGDHGQDGRTRSAPAVARFESAEGASFILDESGRQPLLRFDGDPEVWSLTVTQGPKGDLIYKNDLGQPVLKSTRWGGMILFSTRCRMRVAYLRASSYVISDMGAIEFGR